MDKRSEKAEDDLISKLVVDQVQPGHLSRDDAVQVAFLLLVAGNATMVNMINLGVVTLLQHPEQMTELKKDPSLAKGFVEELCRYHQGSAMATRRVAKEKVEYGGKVRGIIILRTQLTSPDYRSRNRHHSRVPIWQPRRRRVPGS